MKIVDRHNYFISGRDVWPIKKLSKNDRPRIGKEINSIKSSLQSAFNQKQDALQWAREKEIELQQYSIKFKNCFNL